MRASRLLTPLALALLTACVTVNATRLGRMRDYPPVPPEEVVVYQQEMDIDGPFDRVAVIWVEGDANATSQRQLIRAARKKAGRLGANAIVLGRFREPSAASRIAGAIFDVSLQRRAEFLAVRVEDLPED